MWRPLQIFLYDWWPIRADARLFGRLASMSVRIIYNPDAAGGTPPADWPSVPAAGAATKRTSGGPRSLMNVTTAFGRSARFAIRHCTTLE